MRRFIRETWLPTLLFATATGAGMSLLLSVNSRNDDGGWAWALGLATIVGAVTPPVWWVLVARRGRPDPGFGALAGAICGAAVCVAIILIVTGDWVWRHQILGQPQDEAESYSLSFGLGILLTFVLPPAVVFGAAGGAMAALLQRWSFGPVDRTSDRLPRDTRRRDRPRN